MPYDQNADKPGILQMNAVKRLRNITESLLPLKVHKKQKFSIAFTTVFDRRNGKWN